MSDYGLFHTMQVLQNKQIVTSKDIMKDFRLVEKICYFKYGLTYPNKINNAIVSYTFLRILTRNVVTGKTPCL